MKSKQDQAPQGREDVSGRRPRAAWRSAQQEPFGVNVSDENPRLAIPFAAKKKPQTLNRHGRRA